MLLLDVRANVFVLRAVKVFRRVRAAFMNGILRTIVLQEIRQVWNVISRFMSAVGSSLLRLRWLANCPPL